MNKHARLLAVMMLAGLTGCQGLFFMLNSERKEKVTAECGKLAGKKVAIAVWADQSTLDMDPHAPFSTASSVEYFLRENAAKKELKGMTLVDSRTVADLQERLGNGGPMMPNGDLAKQVGADLVLRIDLFAYTTRASEANGLIMGQVGGNIMLQGVGDAEPIYRTEVSSQFPEDSKMGVMDKTDEEVLHETLRLFGESVARKFFSYERDYK